MEPFIAHDDETMAEPPKSPPRSGWFAPVVTLARHLFVEQVQLKRDGGKILVVLQDPQHSDKTKAAAAAPPKAKPSNNGLDDAQLKRMQQALAQALSQHDNARSVMRHLCYCEHTLRHGGLVGLHQLPVELLRTALKQLEFISGPQASPSLAELHACLVVTMVELDGDDEPAPAHDAVDSGVHLSDFHVGNRLEVSEVSHSDFIKVDQQWPLVADQV
jgi:hypothetical protein